MWWDWEVYANRSFVAGGHAQDKHQAAKTAFRYAVQYVEGVESEMEIRIWQRAQPNKKDGE